MKLPSIALSAACAFLSVTGAEAANIAFVSFHGADNSPSAAAAAAPANFTTAPDKGYTDALTAAGHTVTRVLTTGSPNAAVMNAFDLIIISRSVDSANYQGANATNWNNLTAPMMILGGYTLRNTRMGFTTGADMPDTFNTADAVTNSVNLQVAVPSHPIFAGISLDGSNVMTNPFATEVTYNATAQRGISINNNPLAGTGTLLASVPGLTPGTGPGMVIGEWAAGSANSVGGNFAGRRLVFLTGSRENGITSQAAGLYDLNADGNTMFLNAVNYMAVPEPSTATLGLLMLAGALLRRRR